LWELEVVPVPMPKQRVEEGADEEEGRKTRKAPRGILLQEGHCRYCLHCSLPLFRKV